MVTRVEDFTGYLQVSKAIEQKRTTVPQKAPWNKSSEVWSCFPTRRVETSHSAGFKVGLDAVTYHYRLNTVKHSS